MENVNRSFKKLDKMSINGVVTQKFNTVKIDDTTAEYVMTVQETMMNSSTQKQLVGNEMCISDVTK